MTLSEWQEHVRAQMAAGHPFADVEDQINRASVSDDARAALWLLAWSLQPDAERRATEHLRVVAAMTS